MTAVDEYNFPTYRLFMKPIIVKLSSRTKTSPETRAKFKHQIFVTLVHANYAHIV